MDIFIVAEEVVEVVEALTVAVVEVLDLSLV
jgi:hypothetical protein